MAQEDLALKFLSFGTILFSYSFFKEKELTHVIVDLLPKLIYTDTEPLGLLLESFLKFGGVNHGSFTPIVHEAGFEPAFPGSKPGILPLDDS